MLRGQDRASEIGGNSGTGTEQEQQPLRDFFDWLGGVDAMVAAILIEANNLAGIGGVDLQAAANGGGLVVIPDDEFGRIMRAKAGSTGHQPKCSSAERTLTAGA